MGYKEQQDNLRKDIGQKNNLVASNTEKLEEMIAVYKSTRGNTNEKIQQIELK